MAIRTIREEGDEILRKKSREVEKVDEKILELIEDMFDTMHKYNGVRAFCCTGSEYLKE